MFQDMKRALAGVLRKVHRDIPRFRSTRRKGTVTVMGIETRQFLSFRFLRLRALIQNRL